MEEQRLQKVLSAHGVASRRQAEQMITEGRVRVNGNTARLGDKVTETDVIEVDGAVLRRAPRPVYIMLHKPRGYVTTCKDEQGRRDVTELVRDCPERVYPVGRLDLNSEGLLLLTNDGALANRLMHPSGQVEKVYLCWVTGYKAGAEDKLRAPLELDGRPLNPARVVLRRVNGDQAMIEVGITEGRNRQVRRMCELAGLHVTRLKRIGEGQLRLDRLPVGQWRYLTDEEVSYLHSLL